MNSMRRFPTTTTAAAKSCKRSQAPLSNPARFACGANWYLLAWDTARQNWRTFRLDRIVDPIPTGARFTARRLPHGDIEAYMQHALTVSPFLHHARVVVHAPVEALEPHMAWVGGMPEAVDEGRTRIETGANSLDALAVWLACLGHDFEIESPRELVGHLARR